VKLRTRLKVKFYRTILSYLAPVAIMALLALATVTQPSAQQPAAPAGQTDAQQSGGLQQEAQPEAQSDTQPDTQESATGQPGDQETGRQQAGGRFIPSEQISLDLGVSFPVDI
jgi:hypothetical protein